MNKLLKDAIADAKAVRETALANAKVALEEAFAPKLQSMLSHKIKEEMEGDEEEMSHEEPTDEVKRMKKMAGVMSEEDEMDSDEYDSEEEYSDDDMDSEEEYSDDEEVSDEDLEEILRELDYEEAEDSVTKHNHGDLNYAGEPDTEGDIDDMDESEDPDMYDLMKEMEHEDDEEEIDLEEIIKALREEDEEGEDSSEAEERADKAEEELDEAYRVIKFLRSKLNEVNLLNAKLLFVNKLFRKGELTESQKVRVIETFDRAKNVREAKLIYATLSESVGKTTSKPAPKKMKMNEGLASAPQRKTQIISESNNQFDRFKALVEYNKK